MHKQQECLLRGALLSDQSDMPILHPGAAERNGATNCARLPSTDPGVDALCMVEVPTREPAQLGMLACADGTLLGSTAKLLAQRRQANAALRRSLLEIESACIELRTGVVEYLHIHLNALGLHICQSRRTTATTHNHRQDDGHQIQH